MMPIYIYTALALIYFYNFSWVRQNLHSLFDHNPSNPYFDLLSLPQPTNSDSSDTGPFLFVNGATKIVLPNHTDPNYSDVCYTITREMCDFCCMIDFEYCSRDIGICEPVSDRNLGIIVDCVVVLGGIVMGFPLIIYLCNCFINFRCCVSWYETTNGVSCYELIFRCCCLLCCIRFH